MAVNLVTKTECKNYLGITTSNRDTEIDFLIPKVSKLVQTYCRRGLTEYANATVYTQYDNGGYDKIILKETPVINLISFGYSTDYGVTYTSLTQNTDWLLDGDFIIPINYQGIFKYYLRGYKIEYFGGYDDLPDDLKLAVLDLIEYYMKNNSAVHVNRDVTPNVTQINYVSSTNFPAHIKRILDQYVADYT